MNTIAKVILILFFIFVGILTIAFGYLWFDDVGNCIEGGDVWDYDEKRCRSDCLTFIEGKGCIYIDEEFQYLYLECGRKTAQCDEKRYAELRFELCKKYQGAWNKREKICLLEFDTKYCNQFPDWEYPEICSQAK